MTICDRFSCLSPFDIRTKKAHEIFLLVKRLNEYTNKEIKEINKKIRRPAGDDWF